MTAVTLCLQDVDTGLEPPLQTDATNADMIEYLEKMDARQETWSHAWLYEECDPFLYPLVGERDYVPWEGPMNDIPALKDSQRAAKGGRLMKIVQSKVGTAATTPMPGRPPGESGVVSLQTVFRTGLRSDAAASRYCIWTQQVAGRGRGGRGTA